MNKSKVLKLSLIMLILMCCFSFGLNFSKNDNIVYADTIDEEITETPEETTPEQDEVDERFEKGYAISLSTEMSDSNLYSELLKIVKNYSKNTYGLAYSGDTLYSEMLEEITEITIQNKNISSLAGLEHLRLTNLASLTITGNNITSISNNLWTYTPNLNTLNLANNKISSCDISSLKNLTNLNLSSNQLTSVDLTNIISTIIKINLANNYFTNMSDIKLPTRSTSIQLNIISNDISDISEDYFNLSKLSMNIGVQGLKGTVDEYTITTNTEVKFYKMNISNSAIKVYKVEELEDICIATISDSDIEENFKTLNFGVGNYYYVYTIDDVEIYNKLDINYAYFTSEKFAVIPAPATYLFEYKGEEYETLNKVTGKVKVKLFAEENATIMYKVNSEDWQTGSEVMCDQGGNYLIKIKVVIDGIESEEISILVKTSLNTFISDGLMLVLVLLFAIALFVVVVPIVSKKYFKK